MLSNSVSEIKNNSILLKLFVFFLEKINEEKISSTNSNLIGQATFLAEKFLQIIPSDEIFSYRDQLNNNISFIFIRADFLAGIKYLKKNNPKLLDEKILNEKYAVAQTPMDIAILYNAQKIIGNFLAGKDSSKLPSSIRSVLEYYNTFDNEKLNLLKDPSLLSCLRENIGNAVIANNLETFKQLMKHGLHKKCYAQLLTLVLCPSNKDIANHFFSYLRDKNEFNEIKSTLEFTFTSPLYLTLTRNNWIIKLIIKTFSEELKLKENHSLITAMIIGILDRIPYQTEKALFEDLNHVFSTIANKKIKKVILTKTLDHIIKAYLQEKEWPIDDWNIEINKNQTAVTVKWNESPSNPQLLPNLGALDKLLFLFNQKYLNLSYDAIFSKKEYDEFLVKSIHIKNAYIFYYFLQLNGKNTNYRDKKSNNLAHKAAQAHCDSIIYILFRLNPNLFKQRNNQNQLPLELISDQSLLKTLQDKKWKIYHDIKAKLATIQFTSYNIVSHEKWGIMENKYIQYLDQLEEFFLVKDNEISPVVMQACYAEISEYLFYTLTGLWNNTNCKNEKVIELLHQYENFFADKKMVFNSMPFFSQVYLKCLVASYQRFGSLEKALALIEKMLKDESNLIDKNYLTLIAISFYAAKIFNKQMTLPMGSQLKLTQNSDHYLFTVSTAQLLLSKEKTNQLPLDLNFQIQNKFHELFFIDKKYVDNDNFQLYAEICGAICHGIYSSEENNKNDDFLSQILILKLKSFLIILNKNLTMTKEENASVIKTKIKYYIALLESKINQTQQEKETINRYEISQPEEINSLDQQAIPHQLTKEFSLSISPIKEKFSILKIPNLTINNGQPNELQSQQSTSNQTPNDIKNDRIDSLNNVADISHINSSGLEINTDKQTQKTSTTTTNISNSILSKTDNSFVFFAKNQIDQGYRKITLILCDMLMDFYKFSSFAEHLKFLKELEEIIAYCNRNENDHISHYKDTIQALLTVFENEKNWMLSDYHNLLAEEVKINVNLRIFQQQLVGAYYLFHSYSDGIEAAEKYQCYLYYGELFNEFDKYITYADNRLNEIHRALNQLDTKKHYFSCNEEILSLINEKFQKATINKEEEKPMEYKFG